jgi:hypothetical protein
LACDRNKDARWRKSPDVTPSKSVYDPSGDENDRDRAGKLVRKRM